MDKLVRKIEIPLAKKAIEKAGPYIVQKKELCRLAFLTASIPKFISGIGCENITAKYVAGVTILT